MNFNSAEGQFSDALSTDRAEVEKRLMEICGEIPSDPKIIKEAVVYSLVDGGKRLRPILCLWTHDLLRGTNRGACLDVSCAIESLHTYSLIHDDLPCMDDDDMRRGKPSSHRKFGEAVAVLAGDALLTLCFEIIASLARRNELSSDAVVEVTRVISEAAGIKGLIGGQMLDLEGEKKEGTIDMVRRIHERKTAVLISASMESGAIIAGASSQERRLVAEAGLFAGKAFQIIDDVLDVEMSAGDLGKTAGKDEKQGKMTYPGVVGIERSREEAVSLIDRAKSKLSLVGDSGLISAMFDYFVARKF